ncbi:MAG: hypothetical protein U1F29_12085 [Planctomycetota bacterium]
MSASSRWMWVWVGLVLALTVGWVVGMRNDSTNRSPIPFSVTAAASVERTDASRALEVPATEERLTSVERDVPVGSSTASEQPVPNGYVPGSAHLNPFELPSSFLDSASYARSKSFNPTLVPLTPAGAEEVDQLIADLRREMEAKTREALEALESAVTWKLSMAGPSEFADTKDAPIAAGAWVVHRSYADGTSRTVAVLPGECGPLDSACYEVQRIYLEGEKRIADAVAHCVGHG